MRRQPKWLQGKPGLVFFAILGVAWLASQVREKKPSPPSGQRDSAVPAQSQDVERPDRTIYATRADFDFYLLTLSWHPAFCLDGHEDKQECQVRQPHPLAIHGLWPEKLQPGAYPHDCRAPRLALAPALAHQLEDYMPGMQSNLHEHEWRAHGGCSGLDDDLYFEHTLDRARYLDAALRADLTNLAGRETTPAELRAAADEYHPGLGATLVFQCRTLRGAPAALRSRPFLIEVRQCIDDDGPEGAPGTPFDCAAVDRRDQGCGGSFRIAELAR
jgi:ribonuclease T2